MKRYPAGHIVPRHLVRSMDRKAQHNIVFGSDVEVTGRHIQQASFGPLFIFKAVTRRMANGTRKRCIVEIENVRWSAMDYKALVSEALKAVEQEGGAE